MDVLSDVLRVIRLTGAVFFTARFSQPWALASPASTELAPLLAKPADCISLFHVVVEGECWFAVKSAAPIRVGPGSVVVMPHGDAHVMASSPDREPVSMFSILPASDAGVLPHIDHGGGGDAARFVCGYLHCDQRFNPLIGALPRLLVVRAAADLRPDEATSAYDTVSPDAWMELALQRAVAEAHARRPGSSVMLSRLTELLYLEVLRRHMEQLPAQQHGWLAGVRHPEVGHALRLLHAEPQRKWTTADLGRAVGLSRSALAQHFRATVGEPPIRYLTGWRMQLAQHYLRQPRVSIPEIATRLGYESDVAFHRAFKRLMGAPPAAWRRQNA